MAGIDDITLPPNLFGQTETSNIERRELTPAFVGDKDTLDPSHRTFSGYTSNVYIFDLSKEKDLKEYSEVLNNIGLSPFTTIHHISRQWVDATSNWKILLETVERVEVGKKV